MSVRHELLARMDQARRDALEVIGATDQSGPDMATARHLAAFNLEQAVQDLADLIDERPE